MCDAVLDRTHVKYSYRQQCLVSIIVDGVPGTPPVIDPSQWHLPTYDPRNENKYHYRLHSLDIYFWTHADALQFVNGIRRVLPPQQVEVTDEPAPPPAFAPPPVQQFQHQHHDQHQDQMNPLVNKLERAAISDPRYGGSGQTPPRSAAQSITIPSFDPPPISAVHGSATEDAAPTPSFAPMAYNPAAPAAPEQIRHREKTPPPPEDDGPDPLQAAVARDHAPAFTPGYGAGPMSPGFPPSGGVTSPGFPPSAIASPGFPPSAVASPGFPPAQYGHLQRSVTMPVSAGLSSPYGAGFPGSPGFAPPPPPGPPPAAQAAHGHSHSMHSNAQAPPTPGLSPPPVQLSQQHQHQQFQNPLQSPGAPPGGFSNYSYSSPAPGAQGSSDWSIHKQVYRPTEFEATVDHEPKREGRGKLGQNADRIERGVSGVLKKLEKKFG